MSEIRLKLIPAEMKKELKSIAKNAGIPAGTWCKMKLREAIQIEKSRK